MFHSTLRSQSLFASVAALSIAACGDDMTTFTVSIENVSATYDFPASGVFDTPAGQGQAGPIGPGQSYEVEFAAAPGSRLSFATMFVMSNDLFYAPMDSGIELFDVASGLAISGDITGRLLLWDAGTEINQEPGVGPDQAPAQSQPNTGGPDPDNTVRVYADDFGNIPAVSDVIMATLTPADGNRFTLRIENVSNSQTLKFAGGESSVLMAPGVWTVHTTDGPLFTDGMADVGEGLEAIAEDGAPSTAAASLETRTGLSGPIAPGVYAIHRQAGVLFADGQQDRDEGLEPLAEDGDPSFLAAFLAAHTDVIASGSFSIPVGATEAAPVFTTERYQFTVTAEPGDRLSLATMLVQSNDLFFAFVPDGLPLFEADEPPVAGDVTSAAQLWDAGTEVNEDPGAGPNQAPRQAETNKGSAETAAIVPVDDGFAYPAVADYVRITIAPM